MTKKTKAARMARQLATELAKPAPKTKAKASKAKSQEHACDSKNGCAGKGPVGKGEAFGPVLNEAPEEDFA